MGTARIDVGILGATGMVGQQLVRRLDGQLWFRVAWVGTSERTAGRTRGDMPWWLASPVPDAGGHLAILGNTGACIAVNDAAPFERLVRTVKSGAATRQAACTGGLVAGTGGVL